MRTLALLVLVAACRRTESHEQKHPPPDEEFAPVPATPVMKPVKPRVTRPSTELGIHDGTTWRTDDAFPLGVHDHGERVHSLYLTPDGTQYFVANEMTGTVDNSTGAIYRKDPGKAWELVFQTTGEHALFRITGSSADDVWACGTDVVVHWDGHTWSNALPVPGLVWRGLAVSDGVVFASGGGADPDDNGVVYSRATTGAWTKELETDTFVYAVDARAGEVVAVGQSGVVARRVNGAWTVSTAARENLDTVYLVAPGDIYATGTHLFHTDRTGAWKLIELPKGAAANSVWARASNDVFVASSDGVFHWNGKAWTELGWAREAWTMTGNATQLMVTRRLIPWP